MIVNPTLSGKRKPKYTTGTITPSGSDAQTFTPESPYDGWSELTMKGDANLVASNIKYGETIYGVTGTYERDVKLVFNNFKVSGSIFSYASVRSGASSNIVTNYIVSNYFGPSITVTTGSVSGITKDYSTTSNGSYSTTTSIVYKEPSYLVKGARFGAGFTPPTASSPSGAKMPDGTYNATVRYQYEYDVSGTKYQTVLFEDPTTIVISESGTKGILWVPATREAECLANVGSLTVNYYLFSVG